MERMNTLSDGKDTLKKTTYGNLKKIFVNAGKNLQEYLQSIPKTR